MKFIQYPGFLLTVIFLKISFCAFFQIPQNNYPERLIGDIDYDSPSAAFAFDSKNQPYILNTRTPETSGYIMTLRRGQWDTLEYKDELLAMFPNMTIYCASYPGRQDRVSLSFDNDDCLYAIVEILENDSASFTPILLYSPDMGQTFQIYELPNNPGYAILENETGYNDMQNPPAIALYTYRAEYPTEWTSYRYVSLVFPEKNGDSLAFSDTILVSQDCYGQSTHSGGFSPLYSLGNKTHFVYAEIPDSGYAGNPVYIATINRSTKTLISIQFLVTGTPTTPDAHGAPVIAGDSSGYLHVLSGSHNSVFYYLRSLLPNEIDSGWTTPSAMYSSQTYASLICDKNNTLHSAYRTHPQLHYQKKQALSGSWGSVIDLVDPPVGHSGYSIYYHHLFIDRKLDAIYTSFTFYETVSTVNGVYPVALAVSLDGGNTWELATTFILSNRSLIIDATAPLIPQNLHASEINSDKITLLWNRSSDPETGLYRYYIYRDNIKIAETGDTLFVDSMIQDFTEYEYAVSAVNYKLIESLKSSSVLCTTLQDTVKPAVVAYGVRTQNMLTILFSKPVDSSSALNSLNYDTQNSFDILSIAFDRGYSSVVLHTSQLIINGQYTVLLTNIKDRSTIPNIMDSLELTFQINDTLRNVFSPTHDAFVRGGIYGYDNYGTTSKLIIKQTGIDFTRECFLKFDLSSIAGIEISSAILKIYLSSTDASSALPVTVYSVNDNSWTEESIIWYNKPSSVAALDTVYVTAGDSQNYIEWDVTSFVVSRISSDSTVGFRLREPSGADKIFTFLSKDTLDNRPCLEVLSILSGTAEAHNGNASYTPFSVTIVPNPFNPSVTIQVQHGTPNVIQQNSMISEVTIYDISGRLVKKLNTLSSAQSTRCKYIWNAQNTPSGIYVAHIKTGKETFKKKLVLLK